MTTLDPLHRSQRLEIDALRERVLELEALLEHAVYAAPAELAQVQRVWPVGHNLAAILVAMWRAKQRPLTALELDAVALGCCIGGRKDPEYRELSSIRVWVRSLRLLLGDEAIQSRRFTGYWLSADMWARIDAVLA